MKYHVIHLDTHFSEEWKKDVFDNNMGMHGVDTIDGNDYYIPSELWQKNKSEIELLCRLATSQDVTFLGVEECPDENWNAVWEAEHPMMELPMGVKIIPHCAFGAGHHETTAMMIDAMLHTSTLHFPQSTILDHGTGTGVLAIFAKKLGAKHVVAIDIDDKSVTNARENADLNQVDIETLLSTSGLLNVQPATFDLILANIHRNVLIANMPTYAAALTSNGQLWLSGFYEEDCPILIRAAREHDLQWLETRSNGDWRMLMFCK
ncbi:MAG: 50S ribosomal protein L11 methyltransferase [Paludibacteraceae bacterium]|nr:50S ribosomal protein L11 methyltransferase [Paludibacteraceae bacterium]